MDKEILKLKIKSLVALRTSIINVLIVLIGGIVGLIILPKTIIKVLLLCAGVFYVCVFLSNLNWVTTEINNVLDKGKDKNE